MTANHANSLTDALLLVTTVPKNRRSLLRLTAKDTQFGRGTFTSWLIEAVGTLPLKRPKDHKGEKVDNAEVFGKLIGALEHGDMICLFPEGLSRYYPEIGPLRQGVSRIVSETLTRQKDNPDFRLAIQTTSIVYLHRNLFRSDVLVSFHPPIYVSVSSHPDLVLAPGAARARERDPAGSTSPDAHERAVRSLTASIGASIRSGILDAPSWAIIRLANTCRRLYAPLGTRLTLGDHVRLTQRFVDALCGRRAEKSWHDLVRSQEKEEQAATVDAYAAKAAAARPGLKQRQLTQEVLRVPMNPSEAAGTRSGASRYAPDKGADAQSGSNGETGYVDDELQRLRGDLKTYQVRYLVLLAQLFVVRLTLCVQDLLYLHGIKGLCRSFHSTRRDSAD